MEELSAYGPEGLHAQRTITGTTDTISYALLDAQGSLKHLTDSSGALSLTRVYDAWGTLRFTAGSGASRLGYTGELQDGSLVYLRARWYHTGLGTFTSRDTYAGTPDRPQSLHRYGYTEGNPVNFSDPSGHCPVCAVIIAFLLAAGSAAANPAVAYAPASGTDPATLPPSDTFADGKAFLGAAPGTGDLNDVAIVITGYDVFGQAQDRGPALLAACAPIITHGMLSAATKIQAGRVLLIGEGDFSFARSITEQGYHPPKNITASSYENPFIDAAKPNTTFLKDAGVEIIPGIDARKLHEHAELGQFDMISWNFPYVPVSRTIFADTYQQLLREFFASAQTRLAPGGKVVVTLKNGFPYNSYKVEEQARSQGFRLVETAPFDTSQFPGYTPRQTKTNDPIPLTNGATVYVFER